MGGETPPTNKNMEKIVKVSFCKDDGLDHFYYKNMGRALAHAIQYPESLHSIMWVEVK